MINSEKKRALAISYNIKINRKLMGLTQRDLAEILNVAPATVSSWEQGLSTPDIDTIFELCDVFSITVEDLAVDPQREEKKESDPSAEAYFNDRLWDDVDAETYEEMARLGSIVGLSNLERRVVVAYRTADKLDRRLFERIAKIRIE